MNKEEKTVQNTQNADDAWNKGMEKAQNSVMVKSAEDQLKDVVQGYDFNEGINYSKMFEMYKNMGFQSSALGRSIEIINQMIKWKLADDPIDPEESEYYLNKEIRESTRCTIFLGYTSNLVSCGLREVIRYLCVSFSL